MFLTFNFYLTESLASKVAFIKALIISFLTNRKVHHLSLLFTEHYLSFSLSKFIWRCKSFVNPVLVNQVHLKIQIIHFTGLPWCSLSEDLKSLKNLHTVVRLSYQLPFFSYSVPFFSSIIIISCSYIYFLLLDMIHDDYF